MMSGPRIPSRIRRRAKRGWAMIVAIGPRIIKSIGPRILLLPWARGTGGAMVAATVVLAATTRVAVATMVVGRAAIVKMSGIFRKRTFVCGNKGRIMSGRIMFMVGAFFQF